MERAQVRETEQTERVGAERRRQERVCLSASVGVRTETNFFAGFSENISEGGIFVATLSPPPVGTTLDVDVDVEGMDAVTVSGRVSWIRTDDNGGPTGCGIQFINLNANKTEALSDIVRQAGRTPLFYEI